MVNLLVRLRQTAIPAVAALLVPVAAAAQLAPDAKLDESLRESIERGCTGTQRVIVRTKPGYREALRASLAAHGDNVNGEFPASMPSRPMCTATIWRRWPLSIRPIPCR